MKPKLFRVILPVSDIERAAAFYKSVLGVAGVRVSSGRHYFDCDGTILACFDPNADGDGDRPALTPRARSRPNGPRRPVPHPRLSSRR